MTENEQDAAGYQTSSAVNGDTAVNGRVAAGTLAVNPAVSFCNTRQSVIPSGVAEPGLSALLLPIPAGGILLLKRKRWDDALDEA